MTAPSIVGVSPALLRVGAATMLVVLAFSILNPVLAVRLQQMGVTTTAIGIFAMLPLACIVLLLPVMPRIFERFGVPPVYRWGLALQLVSVAGYALTDSYVNWCIFAVLSGVGSAAAWNGTEALVAHNAPAEQRGHFMGLYQTALGASLALGPFVPSLLPLPDVYWAPLAFVILLAAVAMVLHSQVSALGAGTATGASARLLPTLRQVPGLAWMAVMGGVFEVGQSAIITAKGASMGLNLPHAASIAGALGVGSFLLQYPCGWLSDHVRARRLFQGAAILLMAASLALVLTPVWPGFLWVSAFMWGAIGGALYTLTMIRVAHEFTASSTISATAAMILGYTIGGAVGSSLGGMSLTWGGLNGLALFLCLCASSALFVTFTRRRNKNSSAE
jgi:MFS family permease